MRRMLALVAAVSFGFAFLGTASAIHLLLPPAVAASLDATSSQTAVSDVGGAIRLWSGLRDGNATMYLAGPDGTERIQLQQGPGAGAAVNILGTEGQLRTQIAAGGAGSGGANPLSGGINIFADDGTQIVRIGTTGPLGTRGQTIPGSQLVLSDGDGLPRIIQRVGEDTGPMILILDEEGEVVWSAP